MDFVSRIGKSVIIKMHFMIFIVIMMPLESLMWKIDEDIPIDAVVGHDVELPCNVTAENEGDKLSILAWYSNGSSTAFYSRDLRAGNINDASLEEATGRYHLIVQEEDGMISLHIKSVRPSDAGRYRCMVDFMSSPSHNTNVVLNVIEPPQRVWVIYENGIRITSATAGSNASENIGPYYIGDYVRLFCVAFEGKPLANLTWWEDQKMLKESTTPLSKQRIRSELQYGPLRREHHGLVLSCTASNNNVTQPLAIDVVINMYLPPELVSVRDMNASMDGSVSVGRVHAGQILYLQCRVLGARPMPDIQWRINDDALELEQNIIKEQSQRLVISEIELMINESHDEAQVTCCAPSNQREQEALVCAQAMPLSVQYKPVLEIIVEGDMVNSTLTAAKGSNLTLNCSYQANPQVYQVLWFYEDDTVSEVGDEEVPMRPILNLKNVSESDAGEYVCAASNDVGSTYSDPIVLDVTFPAYCEDPSVAEYGLGEGESLNISCNMKSNPKPTLYRWVFVDQEMEAKDFKPTQFHTTRETTEATIEFQRPNGTTFNSIFCWGINDVEPETLHTPCSFLVTDETVPRPPSDCRAVKILDDITVECEEGHNGGLPQKFKFSMNTLDSDELMSIVNLEPKFMIKEPKEENYKFIIVATNSKGYSKAVEIDKDSIIDETIDEMVTKSAVSDITTLALALCGGVLLVALAACGLVLCTYDRAARADRVLEPQDPPLCAYNTDESQCETYHDSEDGSDCNVRRTESFRRAMQRYPSSKNYDVRRTSSFHSTRYMNDVPEPEQKCSDMLRHSTSCRVHSMQNLSRKREMEAACDHLIMHLPPEPNYHVAKPMNTFYTMPRKTRNKSFSKQIRDDTSEITQTSDGFSLPPPPDEFGTYRAASRIRDIPAKSIPTYTTIKKSPKAPSKHNNDVIISPMNTVGLPTISGTQTVYSYPDDHGLLTTTGLITFQSFSSRKESGI